MYYNNYDNSFINFNDCDAMSLHLATWIASQLHDFAVFRIHCRFANKLNINNMIISHVANFEFNYYGNNNYYKISHNNVNVNTSYFTLFSHFFPTRSK